MFFAHSLAVFSSLRHSRSFSLATTVCCCCCKKMQLQRQNANGIQLNRKCMQKSLFFRKKKKIFLILEVALCSPRGKRKSLICGGFLYFCLLFSIYFIKISGFFSLLFLLFFPEMWVFFYLFLVFN